MLQFAYQQKWPSHSLRLIFVLVALRGIARASRLASSARAGHRLAASRARSTSLRRSIPQSQALKVPARFLLILPT